MSARTAPAAVTADFRSASILRDGRVVFSIAGSNYRLVVWINYPYRVIYIRIIGTHAQYDYIDAQTLNLSLATLVEAFEQQKFPLDLPGPVAAIRFRMDQNGLTAKALRY